MMKDLRSIDAFNKRIANKKPVKNQSEIDKRKMIVRRKIEDILQQKEFNETYGDL